MCRFIFRCKKCIISDDPPPRKPFIMFVKSRVMAGGKMYNEFRSVNNISMKGMISMSNKPGQGSDQIPTGGSSSYAYTVISADAAKRREKAYQIRLQNADFQRKQPLPQHEYNGDEERYPDKRGSYTKGLPHNELGIVDINAYNAYVRALTTGKPEDFEAVPLGGKIKLKNPQGAYPYDLMGADSHHFSIPLPPTFSSAWNASELAELYWRALTRDIPFLEYKDHPLIAEAATDLSKLSDYRGPKVQGAVTPDVLFKGSTPGELSGPAISQFLLQDIPYGAATIPQKYRTAAAGADHMTAYADWLDIQNGAEPKSAQKFDPTLRYIRNGRDLANVVDHDFSYQFYLSAGLMLLNLPQDALDRTNPYVSSSTQAGFVTFGPPHILDMVAKAANMALTAGWYQKYLVHRKPRPEENAGRVHLHLSGKSSEPIHPELLNSKAVSEVFKKYGTYLLPIAYPEGSPTHPAYPSGHACMAGACITILKAFFNEAYILPNPVESSKDGLSLQPYTGSPLTLGGELNKLAANVAFGRNMAGIHWRVDAVEGMKLGEAVAIRLLQDCSGNFNEKFSGFKLIQLDGTAITL
jgi:hypothetical protein